MKELSIEEKAKAYDEAIKKVNDYYEGKTKLYSDVDKTLDYLFPELKENKDERIRKALIDYFRWNPNSQLLNEFSNREVFAYLEKQGKNNMGISEATKKKLEDNLNKALEKETPESWNEFLEKQGEQKPTDKVVPKFHEGDWVILTAGELSTTLQIVNVDTNKKLYWFNDNSYLPIVDEECLHLWTIQDAKDGDVLCSGQMILLFKQREDNTDWNFVIAHAGIDISGKLQITDGHWLISNESKPATKEQRDLLFSKMHKAGYEWDAEKKELKKIEQNPAWSEDDKNVITAIIAALSLFAKEKDAEGCFDMEITWLKSLKERYAWKPSDEQIIALRWVLNNVPYCKHKEEISGLLDQIKGL